VCVQASESQRAGYFPLAELRAHGTEVLEGPQIHEAPLISPRATR
jgi:hypothetical protein